MIGTRTSIRPVVGAVAILLAAFAVAAMMGCNNSPVSAPSFSSGDTPSASLGIPVEKPHKGDLAETTGTVEAIDYAADRLLVASTWFRTDVETEFDIDGCDPCDLGGVMAGDFVKVKHARTADADGAFYAREVEVEEPDDDDEDPEEPELEEAELEGVVEAVDGNRVLVAGMWFAYDTDTAFEFDDCAALPMLPGDEVKVEYLADPANTGDTHALKIEFGRECPEEDDDDDDEEVEED